MATTDRRPPADADPVAAADQLRTAAFVRLAGVATGDGLAATAQLARALSARSIPFKVRVGAVGTRTPPGTGDDVTVSIGRPTVEGHVDLAGAESYSAAAYDIAGALADADPVLALAGIAAADAASDPGRPDIVDAAGLQRRPGVGLPTSDPIDGLAWTTRVHAPFSGDPDAVEALLAGIDRDDEDEDAGRRRGSLVAMTITANGGPPAAASALGTVLRPYTGGPVETIPGYADVLAALAAEAPGVGVQLAMGGAETEHVLDIWRSHGRRVHETVRAAELTAMDGLLVARVDGDGPLLPVARLLRDFVAAPPVVAVASETAVVATTRKAPDHLAAAVETASATLAETTDSRPRQAATSGHHARLQTDTPAAVTSALAEAL